MALKDVDFRVDAVLPAGGIGQRMGLETPKQASSYLHITAVTPIVLGEMRTANILPFNRPQHATFEN